MNSIGFYLQVQKSTILHSQSGKGVFIFNEKPVPPGTLIGFYPGIIYDKEAINKLEWTTEGSKIITGDAFGKLSLYNVN